MASALFRFAQFEFPWALGPADGRYVVREQPGGEAARIVVLATLGAQRRHLLRGRGSRPRPAAPEPAPSHVLVSRATVVDAEPVPAEAQARAWLSQADAGAEVRAALEVLDRLIHFQRLSTADPYLHEVSSAQALVVRLGFGEGEQVADGRWSDAREMPHDARHRERRRAVLRPQERLALLLGARDQPLLGEEMVLRARLDLDQHRPGLAALELEQALAALRPALAAEGRSDLAARLAELGELEPGVQAAARAARAGEAVDAQALAHALGRLEAALRARAAAGFVPSSP